MKCSTFQKKLNVVKDLACITSPPPADSRHITNPFNHDYEEVKDFGPYQDLFGSNFPPATELNFGTKGSDQVPASTYEVCLM